MLLAPPGLAYAAASAFLFARATRAERHLPERTPAELGLAFEPVSFVNQIDRVCLRGWLLPAAGQRAIVMLHGIDGHRWDAYHGVPELARLYVRAGFDVLTFDLRAHGESGGQRIGLGWLEREDVRAAVALLRARGIQPGHIGLWGQSFGGGTALLAAAVISEVGAVVTDSAFADVRPLLEREMRAKTGAPPVFMPGVTAFGKLLHGLDLAVIAPELAVPRIAPRPTFLIHGDADSRIPVEHAYRLRAASAHPRDQFWIVPGAEHVLSFAARPPEYVARVLGFFDRYLN
jgi:uncharacterized protein